MTKPFNTLLSLDHITMAYKTNSFPNAYCLLWNQEQSAELLATEHGDIVLTEGYKEVALDNE